MIPYRFDGRDAYRRPPPPPTSIPSGGRVIDDDGRGLHPVGLALGVGLAAIVIGAIASYLAGCAHAPTTSTPCAPVVVESPIGDYVWWPFGDAGPKLLGVRNDCAAPVHVVVACPSSSKTGDGFDRWEVDVPANDEVRVFMQQGARDSFVQVCDRESWYLL